MVPQEPSIWNQSTARKWAGGSALSEPMRSGWGRQVQHQDEDVLGPASVLALCDLPEISGLTFYSVLPLTIFFFLSAFWFCFLPNRKFLTWEKRQQQNSGSQQAATLIWALSGLKVLDLQLELDLATGPLGLVLVLCLLRNLKLCSQTPLWLALRLSKSMLPQGEFSTVVTQNSARKVPPWWPCPHPPKTWGKGDDSDRAGSDWLTNRVKHGLLQMT